MENLQLREGGDLTTLSLPYELGLISFLCLSLKRHHTHLFPVKFVTLENKIMHRFFKTTI